MIGRVFMVLVIVAVIVWLIRRAFPRSGISESTAPGGFHLVFRDGRLVKSTGTVPRSTLNGFEDVASLTNLTAELRGATGRELIVSGEVPENVAQRLRNVHQASQPR